MNDVQPRKSSDRAVPPGQRSRRLGTTPSYSLVIASLHSRTELEACLRALGPVCAERQIEQVVARSTDPAEFIDLQRTWTDVLFMPAPEGSSEAQLRAFGLAAAEGDIVVFTSDQARDPEWVRTMTHQAAPPDATDSPAEGA